MINNYYRITSYYTGVPDAVITFNDSLIDEVRGATERAHSIQTMMGEKARAQLVVWRRAVGIPSHIPVIGEVSRVPHSPIYPVFHG
jgi:hypothetical protein